jgi:hypothetical protein
VEVSGQHHWRGHGSGGERVQQTLPGGGVTVPGIHRVGDETVRILPIQRRHHNLLRQEIPASARLAETID